MLRVPVDGSPDWGRKSASAINQLIGKQGIIATAAKTAAYTITAADGAVLVDATSGAVTITLPAAATVTGRSFHIKKTDSSANAVTVDGDGSETIDGAASLALASQYDAALLLSDGTGWHKLADLVPADVTSGWTQVATSTPTGTGTVTFSNIPDTYSDLLLQVKGISHDDAGNPSLELSLSDNGTNFTGVTWLASAPAAAATISGGVWILGYNNDNGALVNGCAAISGTLRWMAVAGGNAIVGWTLPGGISAVRIAWGAGNFDAGTLTLWGR